MYAMAQNCEIDRASLYQIVNGKRKPNQAIMTKLMSYLLLTPRQQDELIEAYEVLLTGEGVYRRRKQIAEIIHALNDFRPTENMAIHGDYQHQYGESRQGTAFYGEAAVNGTVRSILELEAQKGGAICLIAQPEYEFLFDLLVSLKDSLGRLKITHMICLENGARNDDYHYNLKCVNSILRSGISNLGYEPLFYYGHVESHFGKMNLFPYLILTDECAIQISEDLRGGILLRDEEQIHLFDRCCEKLRQRCRPVMIGMKNAGEMLEIYGAETSNYQNTYSISFDPPIMPFVNRDMLKQYLNRSLPEYNRFLDMAELHANRLRKQFHEQVFYCFTEVAGLRCFLETGYMHEFPVGFYEKPLSVETRKFVLDEMYRAVEEDWCKLRFFRPGNPSISFDGEIVAISEGLVYVQYNTEGEAHSFKFTEKSIAYSFYDYLQSLKDSRQVMSREETMTVLLELRANL